MEPEDVILYYDGPIVYTAWNNGKQYLVLWLERTHTFDIFVCVELLGVDPATILPTEIKSYEQVVLQTADTAHCMLMLESRMGVSYVDFPRSSLAQLLVEESGK